MDLHNELLSFRDGLKEYRDLLKQAIPPNAPNGSLVGQHEIPKALEQKREKLVEDSSRLIDGITRYSGKFEITIYVFGKPQVVNVWDMGLRDEYDFRTIETLNACINYTIQAIGKLESEAKSWDIKACENNKASTSLISSGKPMVFIAHGGSPLALNKLKDFLIAMGLQPLIVEEQASEGRSVAENIDWYARNADCAVILATKGDVDGKTGDFIPRGNVLMEIGKLQEILRERVIYLLENDVKFPTNISEKVWERFTNECMDSAFIKLACELTKSGILKAVKTSTIS
jgi:predicted nucleotide-binding protein